MGLTFSSIFDRLSSLVGRKDQDARILMVGLDAAGKTTILYKLHVRLNICVTLFRDLTYLVAWRGRLYDPECVPAIIRVAHQGLLTDHF